MEQLGNDFDYEASTKPEEYRPISKEAEAFLGSVIIKQRSITTLFYFSFILNRNRALIFKNR